MTNKEFQNVLAQYPEDYDIWVDWSFGWEVPSNKYKEDPYMYINSDFGFIEIEPKEYRDIWIKCSERLPEKEGVYLFWNNAKDSWTKKTIGPEMLHYYGEKWFNEELNHKYKHTTPHDGYGCHYVAWMPIPEFEEE